MVARIKECRHRLLKDGNERRQELTRDGASPGEKRRRQRAFHCRQQNPTANHSSMLTDTTTTPDASDSDSRSETGGMTVEVGELRCGATQKSRGGRCCLEPGRPQRNSNKTMLNHHFSPSGRLNRACLDDKLGDMAML